MPEGRAEALQWFKESLAKGITAIFRTTLQQE